MIYTPAYNTGHHGRLPLAESVLRILLLRLWLRTHYKKALAILGLSLAVVIIAQLAYPRGRLLPFTRMGSQNVGLANQQSVDRLLSARESRSFQVVASSKTYQTTLKDVGVHFYTKKTLTDYPLSARFVPFSAVVYARRDAENQVVQQIDEQRATEYFKNVSAENTRGAVEGSIQVKDTNIVLVEPQAGTTYEEKQIIDALKSYGSSGGQSFTLPAKSAQPVYAKEQLQKAVSQAQVFISQEVRVASAGAQLSINRQTLASALRFVPDQASHTIVVQLDPAVLTAALAPLANQLYIAPVAAQVTTLDGVEIARSAGAAGRVLDSQTAAKLAEAIQQGRTELAAGVAPVAPTTKLTRSYSKTSQGLQILINDWAADNRGPRWSVVVKEPGGLGRSAAIKPDDQYIVASVYKMFLAYPVLTAVANGSLDLASMTATGKTVDTCIEQMIVISSNACGHALGDIMGWDNVSNALHSKGFGATTLSLSSGFYSTAADAARALEQINAGTYLPPAQTARLLDMMRRQIYRGSVPAGSPGIAVANKVGYVDGYRHDAAIVYHPHGTYILSVFSYYGSDPQIANLATRINAYMNQ